MQIHIILYAMNIVASAAAAVFACFAFVKLLLQKKEMEKLKMVTAQTLVLVKADHLKKMFDELNDMKSTLRGLIDDERFEEAEQLKTTIAEMEHNALEELDSFREDFGDGSVDVKIVKIKKNRATD